ncbi:MULTISPECIES: LytTR family transcriptional regulator [unclassified Mesorhizobium]|uniref:LytTR family transcriptional regulator n=1 Tax=unclassified Mesorhizobium TaxID=325217 RepID=UPI001202F569|nr:MULTISPECIES: LytTR family transcriptional regulator [unclassified Mesorhizobium]TIS16750.1 MAG: LytTR family transcriptional regulator [Mesorhizobium sp.]
MWIEVQLDADQKWLVNFDRVRHVRRQYESPKAVLTFEDGDTIAIETDYATLMRELEAR